MRRVAWTALLVGLSVLAQAQVPSRFHYIVPPVCVGTSVTTSDTWQTLVTAGTTGTVFCIQAGTHRQQSVIPKTNQQFIGVAGAIMSGATLLTSPTSSNPWYYTGQTQQGTQNDGGGAACVTSQPCQNPEEVFLDGVALVAVSTLGAGSAGKFFFDYTADRIYIWDDPTGRTVETSVTPIAFDSNAMAVTGVQIRNLVIEKYAVPTVASAISMGPGWLLDDVDVRHNHGGGVGTYGNATTLLTVRNSHIHHNGEFGLQGSGGPILVENNEIDHNNYLGQYDGYWGSGGSKWTFTDGLTVRRNRSHHNDGPGFWTDISNINTIYENNTISDNQRAGIFHEISYAAIIRNNAISRNGLRFDFGFYTEGACIQIYNSPNVQVYGNTCTDNWQGIGTTQDTRTTSVDAIYGNWEMKNLDIHDNTIIQLIDRGGGEGFTGLVSFVGTAPFTSWNNLWTHNTYQLGAKANYWLWTSGQIAKAAWIALPQDASGTFTP